MKLLQLSCLCRAVPPRPDEVIAAVLFVQGGEGRGSRRQRGEPPPDPEEWKKRCADLLAFMQDCEDAAPFKDPVDLELYPVSPLNCTL